MGRLKAGENGESLIEIRGLRYYRGTRRVFEDLDLEIRSGAITAVMGASGSGKTTLLRLISGQLRPDAGTIRVGPYDVPALAQRRLYEMRRNMGMLFQNPALLTDLTVFDNVAFPLREHTRLPARLIRHVVLTKLHAVGLRGAAGMYPSELSGGMGRRVALARAIAMDPDVLMYDEPFVGLDPIAVGVVLRLIRRLNDLLGITSILVSHDIHELQQIADRSYLIGEGRVLGCGEPQELAQSSDPRVHQFMHGEEDGPVPFHYPAGDYASELLQEEESP
jgi:phospholipid/cholesterol/gamma-HCH transport system ATP-binding protein